MLSPERSIEEVATERNPKLMVGQTLAIAGQLFGHSTRVDELRMERQFASQFDRLDRNQAAAVVEIKDDSGLGVLVVAMCPRHLWNQARLGGSQAVVKTGVRGRGVDVIMRRAEVGGIELGWREVPATGKLQGRLQTRQPSERRTAYNQREPRVPTVDMHEVVIATDLDMVYEIGITKDVLFAKSAKAALRQDGVGEWFEKIRPNSRAVVTELGNLPRTWVGSWIEVNDWYYHKTGLYTPGSVSQMDKFVAAAASWAGVISPRFARLVQGEHTKEENRGLVYRSMVAS